MAGKTDTSGLTDDSSEQPRAGVATRIDGDPGGDQPSPRGGRKMVYAASVVVALLIIVIAMRKEMKSTAPKVPAPPPVVNLWDDEARSDRTNEILDKWQNTDYGDIDDGDAVASYNHVQDFFTTIDSCEPKDVWVAYKKCCRALSVLRASPEYGPRCRQLLATLRVYIEDRGNSYASQARQAIRAGKYNRARYGDAMRAMRAYREMMDLEDDNNPSPLRQLYMEIYLPLKANIRKWKRAR